MACEHPFSFLKEYSTETTPTGANVLKAYCGNCGVALKKETSGTVAERPGLRPLRYRKSVDQALNPATA